MISSTRFAMLDLFVQRRAVAKKLPEEALVHLERAAGHDVVERGHALEQRDVLKRARDPARRRRVRTHGLARLALEGDAAGLRMIEAVDHVQHRGLAGAVRADDGADFALADIEGDVADRLDAAERERHALDREQNVAGGDFRSGRRSHAAFPIGACAAVLG